MNPDEFTKPSGKLLRVGQGETAYRAFAPDPLPPSMDWDLALAHELSKADRALGELAGLGRTIPNPHLLIQPFLRREAVLSSRIEGTQTDLADLYVYEAGQLPLPGIKTPPPESDLREVLNYVRALEYGLQRLVKFPVSLRLIREVHERLMKGVRGGHATPGEFRTRQNWIGAPNCTLNEASFVPPPVEEMQAALGVLEHYLHDEDQTPPLARLAYIHYQFEAIHPFIDGNGRIGRLLIILLLVHWNLMPIPLLYLSAYFERNRSQYYDLLMAVSQRSAWREWLVFFLRGVQEQSFDAAQRGKQLQDLQADWQKRLAGVRSARALLLTNSLFEIPYVTIPQAAKLLNVTYQTADSSIKRLVDAGILKKIGKDSYNKTFAAADILKIILQDQVGE
jgi:Fic family protein